jgi:lipid-A-disaccharide synthase-like uncharacterized protein
MNIFKIIGAIGLFLIAIGVITKNRKRQDVLYIIGGIFLEIYSIYLVDTIFIILQIVFTIASIYDLIRISKEKIKAISLLKI